MQNHPEEVVLWGHGRNSPPSIADVQQFHERWLAWWRSCQPVSVFIFNPLFNHFYHPTRPTVPTLSLCLPMLPYVSLCDLYNLDIFPYTADTHTPFPLILLMTIHKIPRARSIGSQLWTT